MSFSLKTFRMESPDESVERMLVRHHGRLREWAIGLTRGDRNLADEIVQDLCLHLCLSHPDLREISNLDGYLYTALRHLYLSNVTRASRERLRLVAVEDYDAFSVALHAKDRDAVDVQNDLLRICHYVLQRKYRSKSASQFLLHFFHGYHRRDVASIARLPIAGVYNNIKDIRTELSEHLGGVSQMRSSSQGSVVPLELLRAEEPTEVFLARLRTMLFALPATSCITEEELLAGYRQQPLRPASLPLLAHLSGCITCIRVVEKALNIRDHEDPLQGSDAPSEKLTQSDGAAVSLTMQKVRQRLTAVREHRPTLLAIAVEGRVIAFHDIESATSSLSSRIDAEQSARFVEVFDELGNRLAYLPIESELSVPQDRKQSIFLSDDRQLDLRIRFDGFGMHAEAAYYDPSLASGVVTPETSKLSVSRSFGGTLRHAFSLRASFASGMACLLLLSALIFLHSRSSNRADRDAAFVIEKSVQAVPQPTATEAIQETILIDDVTDQRHVASLGSVESWRDVNHGELRYFYNAQHRELAASHTRPDGTREDRSLAVKEMSATEQALVASRLWEANLSGVDFGAKHGTYATHDENGYMLAQSSIERSAVISRTLRLNSSYEGTVESLQVSMHGRVHNVRLMRTVLSRVPSTRFPASHLDRFSDPEAQGVISPIAPAPMANAVSASLQTKVLFELFRLHLDTGQPIAVRATADGRVILDGTVADANTLQTLQRHLSGDDRIENHIQTSADAMREASGKLSGRAVQTLSGSGDEAPGLPALRVWLQSTGVRDDALRAEADAFAADAEQHAEQLLQHSAALERLARVLRDGGAQALTPEARIEWVSMVQDHTAIALRHSEALERLFQPLASGTVSQEAAIAVPNAQSFQVAASALHQRSQRVHTSVMLLFGNGVVDREASHPATLEEVMRLLPSSQARSLETFASQFPLIKREEDSARADAQR